jgi:hypothetical protein
LLPEAKVDHRIEEAIHIVTETQAEAVLAQLRSWLRHQPPIDQFREQLEATISSFWSIRFATLAYHTANDAFRQARRATLQAKTALQAMEESPFALMSFFVGPRVRDARIAVNELEQALSRVPFLEQEQAPRKGPVRRAWYSDFVSDLAKIADGIGVNVTTAGDRTDDPHGTPFTRFVFAVEKLLPRKEQSASLAACAKRIDRAIAVSTHQFGGPIVRKGRRRKPANRRLRDK